jgi:hypothetical protein
MHAMPEAPQDVRDYLAQAHPDVMDLALWVRELVLDAEPDLLERIYRGWDGLGYRHPDAGYVCAIYPRGDEVRLLFEHGDRLDDRDGLLEGTGSQTRFIPVRSRSDEQAAVLRRYVQEAVAERLFRR